VRDPSTSRRELLKMMGVAGLSTLGGAALLSACQTPEQPAGAAPAGPTTQASTSTPGGAATQPTAAADMSLKVGYLPITDAAPLLLAHAKSFYADAGLKAEKPSLLRSWSQVAEAFQSRQVDVVHLLMPAVVWMRFGQSFPVKLVAWDHTDGSALTVAPGVSSLEDLAGQTVGVPFWYSIHNLVLQLMLRKANLKPVTKGDASKTERTVKLVVMAPPDMPPALGNGSIAGYIVADPFNAVAEVNKVGKVARFVGDIWLNHACCVVIMHEDDVKNRPQWAQAVVSSLARAQVYARENRQEAARLLSKDGSGYLPQPSAVIERAMSYYDRATYGASGAIQHPDWNNNRIDFQPFPFPSYTEELVKLLKDTLVEGDNAFLKDLDPQKAHGLLVDDRFAREAIKAVGGPSKFGIPESLTRTERIEP
jgi:NitT/TauT family transport system substrate-binding protein